MDKGSRQNGSVTSGQGLALGAGRVGPRADAVDAGGYLPRRPFRAAAGPRRPLAEAPGRSRGGERPPARPARAERPAQNWRGQGESDCLIKT